MGQRRLTTAEDCRRLVAHIIRQTMNKKMDPAISSKLGYLAGILLKCIQDTDLQRRIELIETKLDGKK